MSEQAKKSAKTNAHKLAVKQMDLAREEMTNWYPDTYIAGLRLRFANYLLENFEEKAEVYPYMEYDRFLKSNNEKLPSGEPISEHETSMADFVKSRKEYTDLEKASDLLGLSPEDFLEETVKVHVYMGVAYIEETKDGKYSLVLDRQQYVDADRSVLEDRFYHAYINEF